jgi:hypothetical protein
MNILGKNISTPNLMFLNSKARLRALDLSSMRERGVQFTEKTARLRAAEAILTSIIFICRPQTGYRLLMFLLHAHACS